MLCQRCTRFSEEIAGDKFIDLMDRSSGEQINVYRDDFFGGDGTGDGDAGDDPGDVPFNSYFSGNTIQICPVGALTGEQYRFRARPFDLVSSPSVCEHCSAGCAQRTDHRRGKVLRRLAGDDPAVNEEWNCDKGRWGFRYATAFDRHHHPAGARRRDRRAARGVLERGAAAPRPRACRRPATAPRRRRADRRPAHGRGRVRVREVRPGRAAAPTTSTSGPGRSPREEADFLAASVAGVTDVTYADVEKAPSVVLVGPGAGGGVPDPLPAPAQGGTRKKKLQVTAVAPFLSRGFEKLGADAGRGRARRRGPAAGHRRRPWRRRCAAPGALLIVGERLATVPGGLSAAAALAARTGAKLAWVPRRAGDRGAVDAGCLPNLLPGGRPVTDAGGAGRAGRRRGTWRPARCPSAAGRDTDAIIAAAADGTLGAPAWWPAWTRPTWPTRGCAEQALDTVPFLVSLELRQSAVTRRADVVLPGRAGGGEGRHVHGLGGPAAHLRRGAARPPR